MSVGLIGKKIGMTSLINDDGSMTPVTVLQFVNNRPVQFKTVETDGYNAVQMAVGEKPIAKTNNCQAGHYAKAKTQPAARCEEFRVADIPADLEIGKAITVNMFAENDLVDVQGTTKGKGFAGVVKRHHFRTQDATHGNSLSHRAPGSIGQCQWPGKVFKNKKMAGHMGDVKRTAQSLTVVRVDEENSLILVKGAVPGAKNGFVRITPAMKQKATKGE